MKYFLFVCFLAGIFLQVSAQPAQAGVSAPEGQATQIVYLSGTDSDNTADWEFYCTDGRTSGVWTTIPVPSNCAYCIRP